MKREIYTPTPEITSSPTSTPKKRAKTTPKKTSETQHGDDMETKPTFTPSGGGMSPEKREELITRIIAAGIGAAGGIDHLAKEFRTTKVQMHHAWQAGRKGNLRDKAIKAVRGE